MNFIEEESDSSVDGYDRSSAQRITAKKAKRNKAKYPKNSAGTFNKHDEKGQERRAREEGSSLPVSWSRQAGTVRSFRTCRAGKDFVI